MDTLIARLKSNGLPYIQIVEEVKKQFPNATNREILVVYNNVTA